MAWALVLMGGCGLVLDNDPQSQGLRDGGGFDAGEADGARPDGAESDASPPDGATGDGAADRDAGHAADAGDAGDAGIDCPTPCEDDNPCTESFCDTSVGECRVERLSDVSCSYPSDECILSALCLEGECVVQEEVTCSMTNASCNPDTGTCECDPDYVLCGTQCVLEIDYQCEEGARDCGPEGFCRACVDCTWVTGSTSDATCQGDADCSDFTP